MAEPLPAFRKWQMNSLLCFALLQCAGFARPVTVFISTHEFSRFYPSDSLCYPTGERMSERLCGAGRSTTVKPPQLPISCISMPSAARSEI